MADIKHTPYVEVRDALHAALVALYPREVFIGAPVDRLPNDYVLISGIEKGRNNWATMRAGRKPRDGGFQLITNVSCTRGGSLPTTAEQAALARLNAIEDILATDPTLGLSGKLASLRCIVDEFELESFQSTARDGWTCLVVAKILCEYRLKA